MKEETLHREPILAGRHHELAALWSQFEETTAGRLRVALVAGEPGIGKSRLLQEVARRAEHSRATVLRGGASEAEGMPPYLPFLEALGQHIRTATPDQLREQTGVMASVLAAILPELSLHLGVSTTSYPLPPEQARLRLYEAVGMFLAAIAAPHALLLILDDLQWTDAATLDLLCYVARHQPDARLLILGAYREGEVTHRPAFERALAELNRLRLLSTTPLGPLAAIELTALAADYLGAPTDPAVSHLLSRQSEGNPFFAEELLCGWLETGAIARDNTSYRLIAPIESVLPSSIVGAVRQRLTRLSPQVVELLRMAAIIGRTFDVTLLAEVASQEVETAEEHLQEAIRAQLISCDRPGTFTFIHDTIRECLYSEVNSARRTRLHTLIGRLLEQQLDHEHAQANAQRLANLAFHFARSGDRQLGAVYSQQAAEQALQTYALQEAMTHYRTALTLLSEDDLRRGACLIGLGEAALQAGSFQDAIGAFGAAEDWLLQTGDSSSAARAALGLGRAHWRLEEIDPARAAFEQAVALFADGSSVDTVQALVELGSLLTLSLHEHTEAMGHLERALDLARQLGDARLEAAASRALGNLLMRVGDAEVGIPLLEQALAKASAVDDAMEAAECCACLVMAYNWNGPYDIQEALLHRWLEFARRCHDPYQLRHIYSHLAGMHIFRGELAEAEEALAQSQLIVERLASPEPLAMLQWERGMLTSLQGDLGSAEELLRESIARFRELEPRSLVWWLGGLGFVQALQGNREEVLACLDELEVLIAPLAAESMPKAHTLCFMAAIAAYLGDRAWALPLYPRLLAFRGKFHSFSIDRLLGTLAILLGNFSAARDHLAEAEVATRRFAFLPELAFTLEAQADLALAEHGRSGTHHARTRLEEAVAVFEKIDNHTQERRLRDRLRQLARTGDRLRLTAGLSRREAEVLRLVVQGKSNREIAEALVISERTVANHLASIFSKTRVDNRAAATAFAIRHGLAE